ncbi:MAG: hypothetical protein ACK4OO_07740, partial [bacterium]
MIKSAINSSPFFTPFVIVAIFSGLIFATSLPAQPTTTSLGKENPGEGLTIDFCRFRGEEGQIYLEVYLDLPRSLLTYHTFPEYEEAKILFTAEFWSDTSLILNDRWEL